MTSAPQVPGRDYGPDAAGPFSTFPTAAVASTAIVVALGYGGARPVFLLLALGAMVVVAWLQDDRSNVYSYLVLLGVQFPGPETQITLPFRLAAADFFLLPVIVRSGWAFLRGHRTRTVSTFRWPLMALAAVMAISTAVGVVRTGQLAPYVWFNKDAGILFLMAGFWVIASHLESRHDVRRAVDVFVAGASAANLFALVAAIASVTVFPNLVFNVQSGRLYGWMFNPNSYGCFVTMVALVELGRRQAERESHQTAVLRSANVGLLLGSAGLALARSVWVGLVVGGLVLLVMQLVDRRHVRSRWPVIAVGLLAVLGPAAGLALVAAGQWQRIGVTLTDPRTKVEELKGRLADYCLVIWDPETCDGLSSDVMEAARARRQARAEPIAASTSAPPIGDPESAMMNSRGLGDRVAILRVAWDAYNETGLSRLMGIGLGTFYATSGPTLGIRAIIHSTAAWFLVEMGPIGLFVLIWILARTTWNLWCVRAGAGREGALARGLLAALAFWVVFSIFNEALYVRTLWLVLVFADRLFVFEREILAYNPCPQAGADNSLSEQGATI